MSSYPYGYSTSHFAAIAGAAGGPSGPARAMASRICAEPSDGTCFRDALPNLDAAGKIRLAGNEVGRSAGPWAFSEAFLPARRKWERMGAGRTAGGKGEQILEARTREGGDMSVPQNSLLTRIAVSSVDLAVRYWPENSRRWGKSPNRDRR